MNKKQIAISDVVLIYQGSIPIKFAHIVNIEPDIKKGWWKVTFLEIGIPSLIWTWLLDNNQINQEEFTMNGISHKIQIYSKVNAISEVKKINAISEGDDLI